jgi:predicted anti-sigma-YlaC factor YlaD
MQKWVLNKAASALSADGGTVFSGDDDPELVGDALPFALKTYESLLAKVPANIDLLVGCTRGFCTYAYAFVYLPADTISDNRIIFRTAQYQRAKRLYLRSRDYGIRALELRHPGITALLAADKIDSALSLTTARDTTLLYWTAAAWMGAFSSDKFDMTIATDMRKPVALMQRLLKLNQGWGEGSVHEFFLSYYGSLPASMGGSEEKAREHFHQAVALSKGLKAGPYVALATSVCIAKQNYPEFVDLLQHARAIDADATPRLRLSNILSQRKAQWLLDNRENYFLISNETDGGSKP